MTPQSVGLSGSTLSVGKLSGRRGLQGKLRELGHELEGTGAGRGLREAIALADAKKEVTDADLLALVEQQTAKAAPDAGQGRCALEGWSVTSSAGGRSSRQRRPVRRVAQSRIGRSGRQRPGRRPVRRPSTRRGAGPRVAARAGRLRDPRRHRRRGCPGPGAGALPALERRRRTPHRRPATASPRTSSRRRWRPTWRRSTSSSAERPVEARRRVSPARAAGCATTASSPPRRRHRAGGDGGRAQRASTRAGGALRVQRRVGGAASSAARPSTRYGAAIRDGRTWPRARAADAVLLGAVGGPRWDDPRAAVRPEQALFALRGGLGLFANLRPVVGGPGAHRRPRRCARSCCAGVDLLIVRELTGGLYFGKPREERRTADGREAVDTLRYTEARDPAHRAPGLRAGTRPAAARHQRRQGQRAGHRPVCGARSSRRSARISRT